MTHREACEALEANTLALKAKRVTWEQWDAEVERILDLRFPGERARRAAPDGEWIDLANASRTSSSRGMQRRAASPPAAARPAHAAGPGAQ